MNWHIDQGRYVYIVFIWSQLQKLAPINLISIGKQARNKMQVFARTLLEQDDQ